MTAARYLLLSTLLCFMVLPVVLLAEEVLMLDGEALTRVVPGSFYFEGRSGPTQMRNAAAARFGEKRHVIAALIDTDGYSSDIRAKYDGFFITDSRIWFGDKELEAGAYGFGVTKESKFNIFDVGGNLLLSVAGAKDSATRTPRPLLLLKVNGGVRFYRGRSFVVVTAR
jgi:hypothetical protein